MSNKKCEEIKQIFRHHKFKIFTMGSEIFVTFKEAGKGFLLHMHTQSTHAITNMHASEINATYLDRSCSMLMQMRTVKLPN